MLIFLIIFLNKLTLSCDFEILIFDSVILIFCDFLTQNYEQSLKDILLF
jgi:hypothetical protein